MKSLPLPVNYLLGWALVLGTLTLMAHYVPLTINILGTNYLIFFFHFPSAIGCLVLFTLAGAASAVHLARGSLGADRLALGAAEAGVLACAITLVTGSIWARAAWGVFWVWDDPRLMAVAIMFFTYLGYLALRSGIETPARRSRYAAVYGVLAALNIPVVWYANTWFGKVSHPKPMEMVFETSMRVTMWFGALAFLVLYLALARHRARVAELEEEAQRLEEALAQRGM